MLMYYLNNFQTLFSLTQSIVLKNIILYFRFTFVSRLHIYIIFDYTICCNIEKYDSVNMRRNQYIINVNL